MKAKLTTLNNYVDPTVIPGDEWIVAKRSGHWHGLRSHSGLIGEAREAIRGDVSGIHGDISALRGLIANLRGRVCGLSGDATNLEGNVTGITGDVTGICGNLDDCEITDRSGVNIQSLIQKDEHAQ
jgi:hypothetical protein